MNGPAIDELPTEFRIFYWPEAIAEWVPVGDPISAESAQEAMAKLAPQAFGSYRVSPVGQPDWDATFRVAQENRVHRRGEARPNRPQSGHIPGIPGTGETS